MSSPLPCDCQVRHCHDRQPASVARRKIIQIAAAGLAAPALLAAGLAAAAPMPGDRLVEDDADGPPTALRPADIRPGKPMLAYPLDAGRRAPRDESRLNKLVLVRFAEADLDAETLARSAGGVLAFSAICTHQGCDVKTWLAKEKALVCFCHSSKFLPLSGGQVVSGPAPRALASLPLALDGDQLVIAGPFSAAPGGTT